MLRMAYKKLFTILLILSCIGCSRNDKDTLLKTTPAELYNAGLESLNKERFKKAAENFETLEREYPASDLAANAKMVRSYTYFCDDKYDDALFVIDEFIRQYPSSINTPYMYYLKSLCYYNQIVDIGRDQKMSLNALAALEELMAKFPESNYAQDAKWKAEFVRNVLAGKEMEIGRFYLYQGKLAAAVNRFNDVVSYYNTTLFIPEALYRLTEIYFSWGLISDATKYAVVLTYNYPGHYWQKKLSSIFANLQPDINKYAVSQLMD